MIGILIGGYYNCDGISLCTTSDIVMKALEKYLTTVVDYETGQNSQIQ